MLRLIKIITPKEEDVIQWHTQASTITTNLKIKIYFVLPGLSATKIMAWNWYVDDSTKGRYDMILGRDLLKYLGLNLKLSDHVMEAFDGDFKGYMALVVDLIKYELNYLNIGEITPEE